MLDPNLEKDRQERVWLRQLQAIEDRKQKQLDTQFRAVRAAQCMINGEFALHEEICIDDRLRPGVSYRKAARMLGYSGKGTRRNVFKWAHEMFSLKRELRRAFI